MKGERKHVVGLIAGVIIALFSWLTISPGYPKIYAPLNLLVTIPAMYCADVFRSSRAWFLAIVIVPIFFLLWCWPILRGSVKMPVRSIVLLVTAVLLSAANIIFGYKYGIEYQSPEHTVAVASINCFWWLLLGVLAFVAYRRPAFRQNILFHTTLFVWLAWYAFPYLGELP